ncbi:NAD-dependent epimerase/dehydratase family protein [Allomesorhizobium camelthorni]|uniref:NAD(P)-dependent oxidoreductase n=1 Tax=Allomesorhizobium camelthorni TaxID=475069 RepID=A0A6G4WFU3_9HYPH|nr:NAD(P)-dependent oxidoreductase [Mesorhizobium camelthorni]NGO53063.1 NAD(P)-dependent oxidoreductase [Mesorhizobium camelthorni]
MRVLVTGGCGFLGGWVVRALVRRGHEVRILDARPDTARLDFVEPGLSGRVEIRAGDVTVKDEVMRAAEGCGGAVHLAGIMTVDCRRDPLRATNINLIGSLNLFEAALAAGMRQVAYASTAGVYGPDDGRHPRPMTHYGALKLAVEGSARAYVVDHGLRSGGFRPYIVYGPGEGLGISAGPSIARRSRTRPPRSCSAAGSAWCMSRTWPKPSPLPSMRNWTAPKRATWSAR